MTATYVNLGTYFNLNTTAAPFVSKVIFPEHFKFICTRSFYGCSNLASFWTLDSTTGERVKGRFPARLDRIGDNVFTGCSFSDMACDLYFPGPTQIDDNPGFPGKDYTAIRFGPSFRSVGNGAFENCTNLQSVVFEEPITVTKIGSSAFKGCTSLSSFTPFLPASLTSIGQSAFAGDTALELDLYITNGVTSLNWEQFMNTGITSATLLDPLADIGRNAFVNCHNLRWVKLPKKSLVSLGSGICPFMGCENLEWVDPFLPDSVKVLSNNAFNGCVKLQGSVYLMGVETVTHEKHFLGTQVDKMYVGPNASSLSKLCQGMAKLTDVYWYGPMPADIQNTFLDNKKLTVTNHVNVDYLDSWKAANPNVGRVPVSWTNGSEQWIVRWNPHPGLMLLIR